MESIHAPYDERLVTMIGWTTVEASKLEYFVAYVCAVWNNEDDRWVRRTLSGVGRARRELQGLPATIPDAELAQTVERFRNDVDDALDARSTLVHSVVVDEFVGESLAVEARFWHPRSDSEAKIDADQVMNNVRVLRSLSARAIAVADDLGGARRRGLRPQ